VHRPFPDFDAFLAELVVDCLGALKDQAAALIDATGKGVVVDGLTSALTSSSPVHQPPKSWSIHSFLRPRRMRKNGALEAIPLRSDGWSTLTLLTTR
jgi:hypothetical protein